MIKADLIYVDDDFRDRLLLERIIKKHLHVEKYLLMNDGKDLLEYFNDSTTEGKSNPNQFPSIILLDVKMPQIDGLEALKRLKQDRFTRMIPVVMLSYSYLKSDIQEAFSLGANGYLVKPKNFDTFKEQINTVCDFWLRENVLPFKDIESRP